MYEETRDLCDAGDGSACMLNLFRLSRGDDDAALALAIQGCGQDPQNFRWPCESEEVLAGLGDPRTPSEVAEDNCGRGYRLSCLGAQSYGGDFPEEEDFLLESCEEGYLTACEYVWMSSDRESVPPPGGPIDRALRFGCRANSSRSCSELGYRYELQEMFGEALGYYEGACVLGDNDACRDAGALYEYGLVEHVQPREAERLYTYGCRRGSASSCIGLMDLLMTRSPPDVDRVVALAELACERSDYYCLDLHFAELGGARGTPRPDVARELAQRACDAGNPRACEALGQPAPEY